MTSFILTCLMLLPSTLRAAQSLGTPAPVQGAQVTATDAKMKARIVEYQKRKRPLTIKLKSGAVYCWLPSEGRSQEKMTADKKVKFSGSVLASHDDSFIFSSYEGLLAHYVDFPYQYRISYSDIDSVRVNIIPHEMKGAGEGPFCIFILSFAGADCEP